VAVDEIDKDLVLGLSLAGTFVFGLSGGLAGVRARFDFFGVITLRGGGAGGRHHARSPHIDDVAAVPAIVVGVITAVGGGLLRDLLVGRVPMILHSDLYAVPAVIGATIATVAYEAGAEGAAWAIAGAVVCFVIRLAGIRHGLRVPIAPSEGGFSLMAKDPPANRNERE
jgi:uncharacterized membrane protein YeiH